MSRRTPAHKEIEDGRGRCGWRDTARCDHGDVVPRTYTVWNAEILVLEFSPINAPAARRKCCPQLITFTGPPSIEHANGNVTKQD